MDSSEIRERYLKFFEKRGHVRIEPSPLVLENDPTTLFTSSGMQSLVPYLIGEPHPEGKRLVDFQPCIRTVDIDEVGDNRHLTYFEMLGNWSLGDYFKEEQLSWIWEFFREELDLSKERLYVSVFEGNESVPKDDESARIWKKLGVPEKRILYYPAKNNWWSRSGTPEEMPVGEIGGPDSEVFFDFGTPVHKNCHPNCECGRFLEIGNSVFIQYIKNKNGSLSELPQKNVDFGGGLERIAAVANGDPDVFKTDIYKATISDLEKKTGVAYGDSEEKDRSFRIMADHWRACSELISEGVMPSNKLQGYVLRRLIRRSIFHLYLLGAEKLSLSVPRELLEETQRFEETLRNGLITLDKKIEGDKVDGKFVFDFYQSQGFPPELTLEILKEKGKELSWQEKKAFEKEVERHKELSRTASAGMFKGGLADTSEAVTKLHTATHLLHAALRRVLGEHVSQKGSNITAERLRFDFSYTDKLTEKEIEKVEELINEQIKKDLPVSFKTMTLDKASVKVYTIGDFSKEICGGPHIEHTGEISNVKIIKQEKVGSGVIRIYARTI